MEFLNKVPTKGTDPCYVVTSHSGKSVAVTNFMSGSLCIFRVQADGSLAEELVFRQHRGASLDPIRQMGPHAHSAMFDKNDRYVYIPDLGLDEVVIYHYNEETTELLKVSSTYVKPGAGPRYCEMHPYLDICYLINELDSTIYTYKWNSANGEWNLFKLYLQLQIVIKRQTFPLHCMLHRTGSSYTVLTVEMTV